MLNHRLQVRSNSWLLAGLFTVQLVAASFCMMIPQAHAMPMAAMADHHVMEMAAGHCAAPAQDAGMDQAACPHCHQPDELFQHIQSTLDYDQSLIVHVVMQQSQISGSQKGRLRSSLPTGPPDSSSLLYQITQRIRI